MNALNRIVQSGRRPAQSSDQPADLVDALLQLHHRRMHLTIGGRVFVLATDVTEVRDEGARDGD